MDTSKPHHLHYVLAFIGFSGVITLATFCAKVGTAQEQLATVVTTQAQESKTLVQLTAQELVDRAHIDELHKETDRQQDKIEQLQEVAHAN